MKFYQITGSNFSHHRTAGYVAFLFDPLEDKWLPIDRDDGRETRKFVSAEQAAEYLDAARAAWPEVENL